MSMPGQKRHDGAAADVRLLSPAETVQAMLGALPKTLEPTVSLAKAALDGLRHPEVARAAGRQGITSAQVDHLRQRFEVARKRVEEAYEALVDVAAEGARCLGAAAEEG